MKILTVNELTQQGISISEMQKSLTMTYLNKNFKRKSDLPKKFKDKALSLCAEIEGLGKESFVIETNYSYTIWEEEKSVTSDVKIENKSPDLLQKNNDFRDADIPSTPVMENNVSYVTRNTSNFSSQDKTTPIYSGKKEYNMFQYGSSNDSFENIRERQNQRLSSTSEVADEMIFEDVVKYRGAVVNQSTSVAVNEKTNNKSLAMKKKPRTYRGVAY